MLSTAVYEQDTRTSLGNWIFWMLEFYIENSLFCYG